MKHEHKGRTFWLVGRKPHVRKDGSATELLVWQTLCQECLSPFEVASHSEGDFRTSGAFGQMHCNAHKLTQSEILARGRKLQKTARLQKAARFAGGVKP